MSDLPTPISPPTSSAPSSTTATTTSPSSTFAHKTSSPAVNTQTPFIDTATPAINAAPVELDGVPTSPAALGNAAAAAVGVGGRVGGGGGAGIGGDGKGVSPGLDEEGEIEREFLGGPGVEGGVEGVRQKRAEILASRSKDPSVIVDVPQFPTAEEVEAAKSSEGVSTPRLGGEKEMGD